MLARGLELPPMGSFKDRALRKGLSVERAIKVAEVETILTAVNLFFGGQSSNKVISELIDHFKKYVSLDVFTNEYARKHLKQKTDDMSLLNRLNKISPKKGNA